MIQPTAQDINRFVVYRDPHTGTTEEGQITSFNDWYVFVRYNGSTSAATKREDLEWKHAEVGRELSVSEIRTREVVVIQPPGREGVFLTFWATQKGGDWVEFFSGELNIVVLNFIQDGRLVDDKGRHVRVFEYLGAV